MRVVYIADDGKEFDDEFDCLDYEWNLNHPHLKDVELYDKDGNELKDVFSEETYFKADRVVVLTNEAAKDMRDLAKYTGHCSYEDITGSGIWVYNKDKYEKVGDWIEVPVLYTQF